MTLWRLSYEVIFNAEAVLYRHEQSNWPLPPAPPIDPGKIENAKPALNGIIFAQMIIIRS